VRGSVVSTVQGAADAALARILDAQGIETVMVSAPGKKAMRALYGADPIRATNAARRLTDAWWSKLEASTEAFFVTCADAATLLQTLVTRLQDDPVYAARAQHLVAQHRVPAVFLEGLWAQQTAQEGVSVQRVAWHAPCGAAGERSLHDSVARLLAGYGAWLVPHGALCAGCCGDLASSGSMSPASARALRDQSVAALEQADPACIVTLHTACPAHLQGGTRRPVMHWLEWLERAMHRAES